MNNEKYKPDILIPFDPTCIDENSSVIPLYVRPETNNIDYESLIAQVIKDYGKVIFLANYNGEIINKRKIIQNHYFSQYLFALHGKHEILKYPEFIQVFEDKFSISVQSACILGSIEFLNSELNPGYDEEKLFSEYVEDTDFISFLGNTVKKINDIYVINYDIPAILKKYNASSNILVMTIKLTRECAFKDLNFALYEKLSRVNKVNSVDKTDHNALNWQENVKRTYHIAHNHIEAMFDLTDYAVYKDGVSIQYHDTPLGKLLLKYDIINAPEMDSILNYFKRFPLLYLDRSENKRLINIRNAGFIDTEEGKREMCLEECAALFSHLVC